MFAENRILRIFGQKTLKFCTNCLILSLDMPINGSSTAALYPFCEGMRSTCSSTAVLCYFLPYVSSAIICLFQPLHYSSKIIKWHILNSQIIMILKCRCSRYELNSSAFLAQTYGESHGDSGSKKRSTNESTKKNVYW